MTCEVAPHHFTLTDEAIGDYDTNAKMNPPLRVEADRLAMIAGLMDGTVDCIATDHAPHARFEKEQEFERAPNGITGLETALGLALRVLHQGAGDDGFAGDRVDECAAGGLDFARRARDVEGGKFCGCGGVRSGGGVEVRCDEDAVEVAEYAV